MDAACCQLNRSPLKAGFFLRLAACYYCKRVPVVARSVLQGDWWNRIVRLPTAMITSSSILKSLTDRCRAYVFTPDKNCIPCCGNVHASSAGGKTHYASISPKAELKVHVFLCVSYQQDCKEVIHSTSFKMNVLSSYAFTIFIPSLHSGQNDSCLKPYWNQLILFYSHRLIHISVAKTADK